MCSHFSQTVDSLTRFSISALCVGFESKYCRAKHPNWMYPSLVRDDLDMKGHVVTSHPHRKGTDSGKKKTLFTSSFAPTLILAFLSASLLPPCLYFLSVFSADLCLTDRVPICRTDAQPERKVMRHFLHKQT